MSASRNGSDERQPQRLTRKERRAEQRRCLDAVVPLKRGPPSKYSPGTAQCVLDALLQHGSLLRGCKEPGMPCAWALTPG